MICSSFILSVKASEMNSSTEYSTGMTLRFPRATQMHLDKPLEEALSYSELQDVQSQMQLHRDGHVQSCVILQMVAQFCSEDAVTAVH